MLPTKGYFRSRNCPFYEKSLCERPFCHFKHSNKESIIDNEQIISELITRTLQKVLNNGTCENQKNGGGHNVYKPSATSKKITYNPTPLSELNKYKNNNKNNNTVISEKTKIMCSIPIQYFYWYNQKRTAHNYALDTSKDSALWTGSYIPSCIKTLQDYNSDLTYDSYLENTSTGINIEPSYTPNTVESHNKQEFDNNNVFDFLDEFLNDPNLYETDVDTVYEHNEKQNSNKEKFSVNNNNEISENDKKQNSKYKDYIEQECDKNKTDHKFLTVGKTTDHNKNIIPKDVKKRLEQNEGRKKYNEKQKEENNSLHSKSNKTQKIDTKYEKTEKKANKTLDDKKDTSTHSTKVHQSTKKRHSSNEYKEEKESVIKSTKSSNYTTSISSSKSKKKSTYKDDAHLSLTAEEITMLSDVDLGDDFNDPTITLEECKRIFEEYKPPAQEEKIAVKPEIQKEEITIAKKRVAHQLASRISKIQPTAKKTLLSPAQMMVKRYQMLKEKEAANKLDNTNNFPTTNFPNDGKCTPISFTHDESNAKSSSSKRRIALVPKVDSLINAKRKVDELIKQKEQRMNIMKNISRVAHIPKSPLVDIPMVLQAEKSKLSVNVRSKYLQLLVTECLKLYSSTEAAYERALNEELNCYSRCSILGTYRNSAMLTVNRLRKEADLENYSSPAKRSRIIDNSFHFMGEKFYENLFRWILDESQLEANGFPLPGASQKGFALFKDNKSFEKLPKNTYRCSRCKGVFNTDDIGQPHSAECIYHPLKIFTLRGESKYGCCYLTNSVPGCCSADTHVFEILDKSKLSGFVKTLKPDGPDDERSYLVAALDCEMVYTTQGTELARVTVVNNKCETIYEKLIKPFGDILDYNTRFSGITEEIMAPVTTSIIEVQATLLHMFNSKSILIGHSLENDLIALRLIHETIIDTSVLFPHKYPPRKIALRTLASDYLRKIIQNSVGGHDSAEDAITCMQLINWKLSEEVKTKGIQ